jgi:malonyl-CoA decarboxylase
MVCVAVVQGLAGMGIGRQVIHRTLPEISRELPHLETFVTLSPIPGFLKWLKHHLESAKDSLSHSEQRWDRQQMLERLFMTGRDRERGANTCPC